MLTWPTSGETSAEVLAVLQRYTLAWLTMPPTPSEAPLPKNQELVAASDTFEEILPGIHKLPFIQRLVYLKQLSTVAITMHLDATHSRLSHAIGTAKVATRLLEAVLSKHAGIDQLYHRACVFYAFIHDCFHGPMGHSLDLMKDVFDSDPGEKLDNNYLRRVLDGIVSGAPDAVGRQLEEAAALCWPENGRELIEAVRLLSRPERLADERPDLFFLRDIVDSALDADRIDYLMRDAPILDRWDCHELIALIDSARAVSDPETPGQVGLAYSLRELESVSKALGARRRMYATYYEAPRKLVVDDMLCHGVYYVLRDKGLLVAADPEQSETRREVLKNIMLLTDDDFFAALGEMGAAPQCYDTLIRVRQRNFFVSVYEKGVRLDKFNKLRQKQLEWFRAVSAVVNKLAALREVPRYSDKKFPEDQATLQSASEPFLNYADDDIDSESLIVFAFQAWMRGSFLARVDLERRIWDRLAALDADGKRRLKFYTDEYGPADEYRPELFDRFVPLHVTTSSSFDLTDREHIVEHVKEGSRSAKVLFYEKDAEGTVKGQWKRVQMEVAPTHESYYLVYSMPAALRNAFGAADLKDALFAELRSCSWLWGLLVTGALVPEAQIIQPLEGRPPAVP